MLLDERAVRLVIDDRMTDDDAAHAVAAFYRRLAEAAALITTQMRALLGRDDVWVEVNGGD